MTESKSVPVFNCIVRIAAPGADGMYVATVANLAGLTGHGKTEREAIAQVVPQFKATVARYHACGDPIPWIEPAPPHSSDVERLVAVHL